MAAALAFVVAVASPPGRSTVKSLLLALDVLNSPIRPLSWIIPLPRRSEVALPHGTADLYRPRGFSTPPSFLVVPGAAPKGKDDPRIVKLAYRIARVGRTVLVPQLALRDRRIVESDLTLIREAVASMPGRVGVAAISYGGGLALVALAGDPSLQRRVEFVATLGTYFDLAHLVQGATTNTVPTESGAQRWMSDPEARDIAAEQVAHLLGGTEGIALRAAWGRRDGSALAGGALAVYRLLDNRDPARFAELYARIPFHVRSAAARLSPSSVMDRLSVPIHALHALQDDASPASESRLLVSAARDRGIEASLTELAILRHADPSGSPLLKAGDLLRVVRFIGRLLRAQEGWPRI